MLIFDIGAFDGTDTAHYLDLGHTVVAVEADPALCDRLRHRFHNRATIVHAGVADACGVRTFYVNEQTPILSSFDPELAGRHGTIRRVEIPTTTIKALFAQYGVPDFLKVDIEGHDHVCVRPLSPAQRPAFVSFEAGPDAVDLTLHLVGIGYRDFRLVEQQGFTSYAMPAVGTRQHVTWALRQWLRFWLRRHPRLLGVLRHARRSQGQAGSGPVPFASLEPWVAPDEFLYRLTNASRAGILDSTSWWDVHAAYSRSRHIALPHSM